jgi:nitrate reductase gamma subunit
VFGLSVALVTAVTSGSIAQLALFVAGTLAGVLIVIGWFVYLLVRMSHREPDSHS